MGIPRYERTVRKWNGTYCVSIPMKIVKFEGINEGDKVTILIRKKNNG